MGRPRPRPRPRQRNVSLTPERDTGMEVANFGTVAGLVAAGFGISIVPEHAVQLCHRPGLVAIPLQSPKAVRPVTMIRRRGLSLSVAAQAMWEQLKATRAQ